MAMTQGLFKKTAHSWANSRGVQLRLALGNLTKLTLEEHSFLTNVSTWSFTVEGDKIKQSVETLETPKPAPQADFALTKDEFINGLLDLHLEQWKKHYTPIGYAVSDGMSWKLTLTCDGSERVIVFSGENAFPRNYSKLKQLLGIVE